nr:MAG TPA: CW7 repeat protein [Caudoviricetes sp.]
MTETELRQKVVSTALAWLGTRENTAKHLEMLAIYNAQRQLPRGWKMKVTDFWCAAFVSTVSLQCGLRDIMPTECGCPGMVRLYQEIGRWVEDDAYIPSQGDVIFYDWQDTGYGDNVGHPDHVGIVLDCDGNNMTIIEGNNANAVNKRVLAVNDRFIRGYGIPDFASKADGAEPQPEPAPEPTPQPKPEKPAEEPTVDPFITAKAREVINGKWGNGQARKDALAAWFVKAVQDEVNRLLA